MDTDKDDSLFPMSWTLRSLIVLGLVTAVGSGLLVRYIFSGPELRTARENEERRSVLALASLSAGPQEPPSGALSRTGGPVPTPETSGTVEAYPTRTTRGGW